MQIRTILGSLACAACVAQADIDGGLIGGASLKSADFARLISEALAK